MAYLSDPASTIDYGVVKIGSGIAVTDGIISVTTTVGFTGSRGFTGSQGTSGFTGSNGFTGSIGFTGSQGAGFTGSVGFVGSRGFTGSVGFTGSSGTGGGSTVGTWTPTIAVATAGTITLLVTTANYAKMGQQVICYFDFTVATYTGGSSANLLSLNGLPFASIAGIGVVGSLVVSVFFNLNVNQSYITGTIAGSSSSVLLYTIHNAADNVRLTYGDLQLTPLPTRFVGTITYLSAT